MEEEDEAENYTAEEKSEMVVNGGSEDSKLEVVGIKMSKSRRKKRLKWAKVVRWGKLIVETRNSECARSQYSDVLDVEGSKSELCEQ